MIWLTRHRSVDGSSIRLQPVIVASVSAGIGRGPRNNSRQAATTQGFLLVISVTAALLDALHMNGRSAQH